MVSVYNGGLNIWDYLFRSEAAKHACRRGETAENLYGLRPASSSLSTAMKVEIAKGICEECIQDQELHALYTSKSHPICYDGFEPSGRMHIAQALKKAHIVNKLAETGAIYIFWVADWFAMLNNKFGGDLYKIRMTGKYFIEVWKSLGMNMKHVKFLWASEEINKSPDEYWTRVMRIAQFNTVSRIKRCSQIMGRVAGDEQPASSILYPCMQCSDIFYLGADICQLGMDQRKVNMLAREYAAHLGVKSPIILSHRMLPALDPQFEKMSKSNPASALFVDDEAEVITKKIKKAYCPQKETENNPCVEYVDHIIFPLLGTFQVERQESDGGNITFNDIEEFHKAYTTGSLHPGDLKNNLARQLNFLLDPIRRHFQTNEKAKKLYHQIQTWTT